MRVEIRIPAASAFTVAVLCAFSFASDVRAQGTLGDYQRGQALQAKSRGLVVNTPGAATWIGNSGRFWYSRPVKGGTEFIVVDATSATKGPAFDHEKLASAISSATGKHYTALALPFAPVTGGRGGLTGGGRGIAGATTSMPLNFADEGRSIEFGTGGFLYKCVLSNYTCAKTGAIPQYAGFGTGGRGGQPRIGEPRIDEPEDIESLANPEAGGDPVDGLAYEAPAPPQDDGGPAGFNRTQAGCAPRADTEAQIRSGRGGAAGRGGTGRGGAGPAAAGQAATEPPVCASFDGKWEALIENFNVFLRPAGTKEAAGVNETAGAKETAGARETAGAKETATPLSADGSEGNYYTLRSIAWSPDSRKLVAYRTRPGYDRQVHYIESSPADQIEPKHFSIAYRKPGDALDIAYPVLFDVETKKEIEIDQALFPNPYSLTMPRWWKDSRGFTFEYNQRGHQMYRVIEVDSRTGQARSLITEESKTFIYYNNLSAQGGRKYRHDVDDGREIIWGSERDGWEHLYLYDGLTGRVKNQITKGEWLVRAVDFVDDAKRQIWFQAGGANPGQDPYFIQYYRINFDGSGLTRLTDADGTHTAVFSPDRKYYVDTWQRVDVPPVAQLRRTEDQKVVMDVDKGDATALLASGIRMPEVFVAKGRDGKTDIWGTIVRPTNFDPSKKYPVIEQIYAGPQGSFVPKTFTAVPPTQALAELGFIVVQIDGMGTSNRSKAFHDVAYKNLGDAGFPDRILWHKAVAAKYPSYDISRVGIYGTSAGGQNSLGGMLFHPEFYQVAVTNSGCHDNRMDKIWWNEQWMGWPVGPEYAASSNVDNAYRLQGKVLIIIGELDSNVDPASSMQVVNALVKANKHFDMMYIPGQNHGVPVLNSQHYRDDYFVHHLLEIEPPDWNRVATESTNGN